MSVNTATRSRCAPINQTGARRLSARTLRVSDRRWKRPLNEASDFMKTETVETETHSAGSAPLGGSAAVEREKRQWWAIDSDDDDVKLVTGYSCAPNSPSYWWIPQLGSSMAVGFHLFETERAALDKAIEKLERKITVAQDNIEALKKRGSAIRAFLS